MGQIRRDVDKACTVTVERIEDSNVHGTYKPIDAPAAIGFSVWNLESFSHLPLLSDPEAAVWRVSGQLPWGDAAAAVYAQIGTVHSHRTQELTEGGMKAGALSIDVVAPNAEIAKARIAEISGLVGAPLSAECLQARPAES